LPFHGESGVLAILGKIRVVPAEGLFEPPPLPERIVALRDRFAAQYRLDSLDSEVPALHRVVEQVRLAAASNVPILLQGEAGVGKHWTARVIHRQGPRRGRPFVRLACAPL